MRKKRGIYIPLLLLSLIDTSVSNADNVAVIEVANKSLNQNSLQQAQQAKVSQPLSGSSVYRRVCMACHTLSVWGAPKLGDIAAWKNRIRKGKEALYLSAFNGINNMPPRGYCQFCTDKELMSAVDYMLKKSQLKEKPTP